MTLSEVKRYDEKKDLIPEAYLMEPQYGYPNKATFNRGWKKYITGYGMNEKLPPLRVTEFDKKTIEDTQPIVAGIKNPSATILVADNSGILFKTYVPQQASSYGLGGATMIGNNLLLAVGYNHRGRSSFLFVDGRASMESTKGITEIYYTTDVDATKTW